MYNYICLYEWKEASLQSCTLSVIAAGQVEVLKLDCWLEDY